MKPCNKETINICKCGCGNIIPWKTSHKYYMPSFIFTHQFRMGFVNSCVDCSTSIEGGSNKKLCDKCVKIHGDYWDRTHPEKKKECYKKYDQSSKGIYRRLKTASKQRYIFFDLNRAEFIAWWEEENKICIYCKRTLTQVLTMDVILGQTFKRFSIDRKDNNQGYTIDNIVLACMLCNKTKGNLLTYEQMLIVGQFIRENWIKEGLL